MPSFEAMFMKSKGKSITYQGRTLVMSDAFPMEEMSKLRLTFESCKAQWRQGVALKCDGYFIYKSDTLNGRHGLVFWQDTSPASIDCEIGPTVSTVRVYNVWDVGDGVIEARHNGAAMIVEDFPNGRRYLCNDGFADDDFDDIVFRLERVS